MLGEHVLGQLLYGIRPEQEFLKATGAKGSSCVPSSLACASLGLRYVVHICDGSCCSRFCCICTESSLLFPFPKNENHTHS